MSTYIMGGDIGQSVDPTTIAILKHKPFYKEVESHPGSRMMKAPQVRVLHNYDLVLLEKVPLNTPYPKVVERFEELSTNPNLVGDLDMVMDVTGVGRAVYDYMLERKIPVIGVLMTGGDAAAYNEKSGLWSVPKKDLVASLVMLYQSGRLRMNSKLPMLDEFQGQVLNFSAKLKKDTGHMSYEAMTESVHDDLVIAVAMAAWWAQLMVGQTAQILETAKRDKTYDPKRFRLSTKKR